MPEKKFLHRSINDWNPAEGDQITGVVDKLDKLNINGKLRQFMIVDTEESGLVRVWHSEGLAELWKVAKKGVGVAIRYLETVPTKKKGQTFKKFATSAWTE